MGLLWQGTAREQASFLVREGRLRWFAAPARLARAERRFGDQKRARRSLPLVGKPALRPGKPGGGGKPPRAPVREPSGQRLVDRNGGMAA